ncbi:MAG TPA: Gfo/Idh/MocA family oxidoreductase [Candidatus Limnocylindrales bacterium]
MGRLGLAIVGAGRMGSGHARLIARGVPEIEITAIADVNLEAARRLGAELGGVRAFADYEAAISAPGVDAVLVAVSSVHHRPVVEAAAAAGRDILCEKPLALTMADTDAMLAEVSRAGVRLQVGLMRRHDPEYVRARERIAAGELGRPRLFNSRQYDTDPAPAGFLDPAVSGGILVDMGIHEFDAARYLLADEVTEVSAMGGLVDPAFAGLDDADVAVVGLRFASGALGSVELSRRVAYGEDVRTEVHGPDASAFIGALPVPGSSEPRFAAAYAAEARAFAAAIREDRSVTPNGDDGRAAFAIAVAADRARREGRVVRVHEVAADLASG